MKSRLMRKVGAVTLVAALSLSMMAVPAFADIPSTATGAITVTGTDAGTVTRAYKIVNVNYDMTAQQMRTPQFSWVASVKAWVTTYDTANGTSFAADPGNLNTAAADDAKAFLTAMGNAIRSGDLSVTAETDTATGTTDASISGLSMGAYLLLATDTASAKIYQTTSANLFPVYDDTTKEWTFTGTAAAPSVSMKSSTPGTEKEITSADKTVKVGDTVSYAVSADVPKYPADTAVTSFMVADDLSDGLSLTTGTVKVYGVDATGNETLLTGGGADYTYADGGSATVNGATVNFDFNVQLVYAKVKGYSKVRVKYDATVNTAAVVGENPNAGFLQYKNNPYDNTTTKTVPTDEPVVYVYGLDITKVATKGSAGLEGAEFTVTGPGNTALKFTAKDATAGEYVYDPAGTLTKVTSGTDGKVKISGLDTGTYTLTEVKAPDGYKLPTGTAAQTSLTITDAEPDGVVDGGTSGAWKTGEITNTPEDGTIILPATGGMGTIAFSVLGAVLVAGAVSIVVTSRRKDGSQA